jgi:hypothetical protein
MGFKFNILDSKKEEEWVYYGRMMALFTHSQCP